MGFTRSSVVGAAAAFGVLLTIGTFGTSPASAATPAPSPTSTSQGLTIGLPDLPVVSVSLSSTGVTIGLLPLPSATPLLQVTLPGVGLTVLGQGKPGATSTLPVVTPTGQAQTTAVARPATPTASRGATAVAVGGSQTAAVADDRSVPTSATPSAAPPHLPTPRQPGAVGTLASALRISYPWLLAFAAGTGVLAVGGIFLLSALPGVRRQPAAAVPARAAADPEDVAASRDPDWDYTFDRTDSASGGGASAGLRRWVGLRRGRTH